LKGRMLCLPAPPKTLVNCRSFFPKPLKKNFTFTFIVCFNYSAAFRTSHKSNCIDLLFFNKRQNARHIIIYTLCYIKLYDMAIFTKENTTNRKEYNILGRELQLSSISRFMISADKTILCCDIIYPNCLLDVAPVLQITLSRLHQANQVTVPYSLLFFLCLLSF
jgi:hypothetical protein